MVKLLVRGALGTALALSLAAGLGACNTMEGFGKDMSAAGRALSGSAERTKNGGSPFSASSGNGAADSTSSTASNAPASAPPTVTSPAASGSGGTSTAAPVTPVTPVN